MVNGIIASFAIIKINNITKCLFREFNVIIIAYSKSMYIYISFYMPKTPKFRSEHFPNQKVKLSLCYIFIHPSSFYTTCNVIYKYVMFMCSVYRRCNTNTNIQMGKPSVCEEVSTKF